VEMAIVLPLLMFLVMGIIDFGRMLNAQIELSQGAREGVRLAALSEANPVYSTSATVLARVRAAAPNPGFQPASVGVSLSTFVPCPNPSSAATVSAKYHFTGILWRAGPGVDLEQKAIMRCGG
jgi:Flp pilus assembly protein TadG